MSARRFGEWELVACLKGDVFRSIAPGQPFLRHSTSYGDFYFAYFDHAGKLHKEEGCSCNHLFLDAIKALIAAHEAWLVKRETP